MIGIILLSSLLMTIRLFWKYAFSVVFTIVISTAAHAENTNLSVEELETFKKGFFAGATDKDRMKATLSISGLSAEKVEVQVDWTMKVFSSKKFTHAIMLELDALGFLMSENLDSYVLLPKDEQVKISISYFQGIANNWYHVGIKRLENEDIIRYKTNELKYLEYVRDYHPNLCSDIYDGSISAYDGMLIQTAHNNHITLGEFVSNLKFVSKVYDAEIDKYKPTRYLSALELNLAQSAIDQYFVKIQKDGTIPAHILKYLNGQETGVTTVACDYLIFFNNFILNYDGILAPIVRLSTITGLKP